MSIEARTLLSRECADAEAIIREIVQQENSHAEGPLSWDESPLKPWIIDKAKTLLIYRTKKTSFFYGSLSGSGILLQRLPSSHPSLVKWSAPLFVKVTVRSGGISFGNRATSTFAVCTSNAVEKAFVSPNGRRVVGLEFAVGCGASIQERADLLTADFSPGLNTVGVSKVSGSVFDISFGSGKMTVDEQKMATSYGKDATARRVFTGEVQAPAEFQPLYGELNRIVNRVERQSASPGRVSASLERLSTGRDPDQVMVLPSGVVIREDLMGPPGE